MKNTITALVSIYILCAAHISGAQSSSFQKRFISDLYTVHGTASFHEPGALPVSGEQVICFSAQIGTPGKFDIVLLKIDSAGSILNSKILTKDPGFHDWTREFIRLGSNYYMTGSSRAFDTSTFHYESSYLLKFDANLDVLSQTNYFLPDRELFAQALTATSDGKILMTGVTSYNSNWQFFLLKTDTTGNVTWFKQYPLGIDANVVREVSNGDIMIAGSMAYSFQFIQPMAFRFDSNGNLLWAKNYIYATGAFDYQNSNLEFVHDFGNGNILLAGRTDYSGIAALGFMDSYVLMVNNAGDVTWSKTFGAFQSDWAYDYSISSNNELVICGSTGSFFNYSNYGFVQVMDTSGALVSSYAFGDTTIQEQITLTGFRQLSAGNSMVIGYKTHANLFNLYVSDFSATGSGTCPVYPVSFQSADASSYPVQSFVAVADSSLTPYTNNDSFNFYSGINDTVLCAGITSVDENPFSAGELTVFPNPATDHISIAFSHLPKSICTVKLSDVTGRVMKQTTFAEKQFMLDVSAYTCGIYILQLYIDDEIYFARILKE
ncbi:MAG TPA: T9SS type A sorting domain-containing protein [Bacteroidia bacterium]|nr:T9SS type A sorting domain-containing protein [Bacteroidia bacterium]